MKTNKPISDFEIVRALIQQVSKTVPNGGNEHDVMTFVSKPMMDAWNREIGSGPVYGSKTKVFKSKRMYSWSQCRTIETPAKINGTRF